MKDDFIVMKYNSKEWAIYGKRCRCFIVFGCKSEIIKRCKILNKIEGEKNER